MAPTRARRPVLEPTSRDCHDRYRRHEAADRNHDAPPSGFGTAMPWVMAGAKAWVLVHFTALDGALPAGGSPFNNPIKQKDQQRLEAVDHAASRGSLRLTGSFRGLQHVHNVAHFPEPLRHASAHRRRF